MSIQSHAFGHPVTIKITRPENIFVFDEMGDNTHGKEDTVKGGEKMLCLKSQVPKEEVGDSDRHFTVVCTHVPMSSKENEEKSFFLIGVKLFCMGDYVGTHGFLAT